MISPHECIDHLRDHAREARGCADPESVHELRVAAGRLSVWLELGQKHILRDDLSWLRRSASRTRDLDVVLELLAVSHESAKARLSEPKAVLSDPRVERGPERTEWSAWSQWPEFIARLHAAREIESRALTVSLASPRITALLAALSWMPALDHGIARASLPSLRDRVERASKRLARKPEDLGLLHRLRRAVRRLRYGLEWIGDDAHAVKAVQDALGELNDLTLILRFLDPETVGSALPAHDSSAGTNGRPNGPRHEPKGPTEEVEHRARNMRSEHSRVDDASMNGASIDIPVPRDDVRREIARCRKRFLHDWSRNPATFDGG